MNNEYAVIKYVNGAFAIVSEWNDKEKAIVAFHTACTTLWNAADVEKATVAIVGDDLAYVDGYVEHIKHTMANS